MLFLCNIIPIDRIIQAKPRREKQANLAFFYLFLSIFYCLFFLFSSLFFYFSCLSMFLFHFFSPLFLTFLLALALSLSASLFFFSFFLCFFLPRFLPISVFLYLSLHSAPLSLSHANLPSRLLILPIFQALAPFPFLYNKYILKQR